MGSETTVQVACNAVFSSVLIRLPEPPITQITVNDGCSVEVLLGSDPAESWATKTGRWKDA